MAAILDAIIVGAGQAGLAAGYALQRVGLRFLLLEAGVQPAGSWPHYYNSLKLFSTAKLSALPGLPFPAEPGHYPARDAVVRYLNTYASHFGLPVLLNTRVNTVRREASHFVLTSADGRTFAALVVIAATGLFGRPFLPQLPGQTEYRGQLLHTASYRSPAPFVNQRVVVVGGGNSGVQIAAELSSVARVTLTTRNLVRFAPQRILGRDLFFWVNLSGVDRLPLGHLRCLREPQPVIDSAGYRAMLRAGRLPWQPMFKKLMANGVQWVDGRSETIDAVILATGYRPNLTYLRELGVLDAADEPVQRAGVSLTTPGLFFVGLPGQRTFASATLRGVGPDAMYVATRVQQFLRQHQHNRP